jgi:hypothetical protein
MTSHFWLLVLFALFVSTVFAVLQRETPREQLRYGAILFAGFVLGAYVLGWIMYPFPLGGS